MWKGQITCLALLLVYPLGQFLMQDSTSCPTPYAPAGLLRPQDIWFGVSCRDLLEYSCDGPRTCRDSVLGDCDSYGLVAVILCVCFHSFPSPIHPCTPPLLVWYMGVQLGVA